LALTVVGVLQYGRVVVGESGKNGGFKIIKWEGVGMH